MVEKLRKREGRVMEGEGEGREVLVGKGEARREGEGRKEGLIGEMGKSGREVLVTKEDGLVRKREEGCTGDERGKGR